MRLAAIGACLIAGALACPPVALGAFPGRDGAIAFWSANESGEDCPVGHDDSVFAPCTYNIFRVHSSGSRQRLLSSCGTKSNPECSHFSPAWSPRGTRIAFNSNGQLWTMKFDGSGARPLGVDGAQPAWSPDGRRLVFVRDGDIAVVNKDGTGLRTLTAAGRDTEPTWSTSNLIAFRRFADAGSELMTMKPDGTRRGRILRDCGCGHPDFSPDGRKLAYGVDGGPNRGVYIMFHKGGTRRRILTSGSGPAWSPSGRFIAYVRKGEIWIARSDGSKPHRIPYDSKRRLGEDIAGEYSDPSWQPLPLR